MRLPGVGDLVAVASQVDRLLAGLVRDLTALIERQLPELSELSGLPDGSVVDPEREAELLAARLTDQLGREPSREELVVLLSVVDGLLAATALREAPEPAAVLSSYAAGLRRDIAAIPTA